VGVQSFALGPSQLVNSQHFKHGLTINGKIKMTGVVCHELQVVIEAGDDKGMGELLRGEVGRMSKVHITAIQNDTAFAR
jgi:hypothetical protein